MSRRLGSSGNAAKRDLPSPPDCSGLSGVVRGQGLSWSPVCGVSSDNRMCRTDLELTRLTACVSQSRPVANRIVQKLGRFLAETASEQPDCCGV
jgi:hypothetical protein